MSKHLEDCIFGFEIRSEESPMKTKESASDALERLAKRVDVLEVVVATWACAQAGHPYNAWGRRIRDAMGPSVAAVELVEEAIRQMDAENEEPAFEWWCFAGEGDMSSVVTWGEILEIPLVKTWVNATGFRKLVLLERRRTASHRYMTLFAQVGLVPVQADTVPAKSVPLGTVAVPHGVELPCEEVTSP